MPEYSGCESQQEKMTVWQKAVRWGGRTSSFLKRTRSVLYLPCSASSLLSQQKSLWVGNHFLRLLISRATPMQSDSHWGCSHWWGCPSSSVILFSVKCEWELDHVVPLEIFFPTLEKRLYMTVFSPSCRHLKNSYPSTGNLFLSAHAYSNRIRVSTDCGSFR